MRFIFAFFIFSCGESDFDERRNNLIGEWRVSRLTQEIYRNEIVAEYNGTFTLMLAEDGTGVQERPFIIDSSISENINWLYQYNPEQIIVAPEPSGSFLSSSLIFNITINESERQEWVGESTTFLPELVDKYIYTYSLVPK